MACRKQLQALEHHNTQRWHSTSHILEHTTHQLSKSTSHNLEHTTHQRFRAPATSWNSTTPNLLKRPGRAVASTAHPNTLRKSEKRQLRVNKKRAVWRTSCDRIAIRKIIKQ